MSKTIKKYPIFYQGEEYEMMIEKIYKYSDTEDINIYKVIKYKNWFGKEKTSYNLIYSIDSVDFNFFYGIKLDPDSETYYVDLFKEVFNLYLIDKDLDIKRDEKTNKQLAALENWDGVIS